MRVGHRPLIFRALIVLDEAIELARDKPLLDAGPGVKLALAYLFALSDGDRRCFDEFLEHLSREPLAGRHVWQESYIRSTYGRGCLDSIVRSIGFWPNSRVMLEVSNARHNGYSKANEPTFWSLVDDQARSETRRPRPGCEWLMPRSGQTGVSPGVSSSAE